MKKLFFLFALLTSIAASATVTVTPLSVNYNDKTVTFRVEYANAVNNRAWVWIDLCPVPGVTPGTFQTAVISAVSAISGSVLYVSTNTRGFFVTTNNSTVTATLSNASGKFNWCAYGSDAPPNVTAANGTYTFKGTPPFILTSANGTATQTVNGKTLPTSALTVTPVILTDRTGYSGIFCPYQKNDLLIDATHICQQRTSGAKNWEAYIKDVRDNQIYRIVQMPTNTWWMADDLLWDGKPNPDATNYTIRGTPRSCGAHYGCGRMYQATEQGYGTLSGNANSKRISDVCCPGWLIPSTNEVCEYAASAASPQPYLANIEIGGPDTYGLSLYVCGYSGWLCGSGHTNYASAYIHVWRWYRDNPGDPEVNCRGAGGSEGLHVVRCVRDL
jgi:hypothetical protein